MAGPKVAPKPAHAKLTTRNTELFGFHARISATSAMPKTVRRAYFMLVSLSSFFPPKSWTRSWETEELAASSWESAVLMVAARMPAMMTPAISAKKKPY